MDDRIKFQEYDHHEALFYSTHVIDKLFQLLAMFHSSRSIANLAWEDAVTRSKRIGKQYCFYHPLEKLRDGLFHTQATKLLTEIAVYMRIIDDRFAGEYPVDTDLTCGSLIEAKNDAPLALREAWNKILHASRFDFTEEDRSDWRLYRNANC